MYKFTRSSYFWNHSSELDTLVNQNSHATPIRSPVRGRMGFSKSRGLRASVTFFPLPHPAPSNFLLSPLFHAARMRKPLLLGPTFVRIVREPLLRRLHSLVRYWCEHSKINSISLRVHVSVSIYHLACSQKIFIMCLLFCMLRWILRKSAKNYPFQFFSEKCWCQNFWWDSRLIIAKKCVAPL